MVFRLPSFSPVAWVTFEKVTQQGLWLILFAVLAPILGPRPYGLFSIVMVFVGVCELILLEGAIEALVMIRDLDHLHTTTANLANGGIALALAAGIFVLAPVIGALFHDDDIKLLMWTLIPLPLLSSLAATPLATLRRSMSYRTLAMRSIIGLIIGGAFGIALAVAGFGVWALAAQVLAQRTAEFVIAWASAPVRIGFRWSGPHFRELRPVAINVFAGLILTFASGQLPRLILGYMLGPTELGLFTLANRFLDMIVQTAVLPVTAVGRLELRSSKPGSPEFEGIFTKVMQNVSLLTFSLFLGAAVVTPELFRIWLNERWQDGVVPMQYMLLSGIPLTLFYCVDMAFFAANLSRYFVWTAFSQVFTMSITVLCVSPFGLDLTCLALAIRPWLVLPIFLILLRRTCHVSIFKILWSPLRSLIGAIAMGGMMTMPFLRPSWLHQVTPLIVLIPAGMGFYFIFLYGFLWTQFKTFVKDIFIDQS
jgi:O-antigen/teichoic acid export membrane protein